MAKNGEWSELLELANSSVERAKSGDYPAAMEVISQSVIGLRGVLDNRELPDPFRAVFLRALLTSLEEIEQGQDPQAALRLRKPTHRVADPDLPLRNALLFVLVGEELDRLTGSEASEHASPVRAAIERVAERRGLTVATLTKVWTEHGSRSGWERRKSERK